MMDYPETSGNLWKPDEKVLGMFPVCLQIIL